MKVILESLDFKIFDFKKCFKSSILVKNESFSENPKKKEIRDIQVFKKSSIDFSCV